MIQPIFWSQRMRNACTNLWAARRLRPRVVRDWSRIVSGLPMEPGGDRPASFALDAVSRMRWEYLPCATHPRSEPAAPPPPASGTGPRVAHFVDAPGHISGVTLTIREWMGQARAAGHALEVFTCGEPQSLPGARVFPPIGSLRLSAYAGLDLHVPDIDAVRADFLRGEFDLVHVSTPGPMGLLGLRLARAAGLPVAGTYHTDFPRYARELSGDPGLEQAAWRMMRWFYGQLDAVAAPSASTASELIGRGRIPHDRVRVVGRGVDPARFHPGRRMESIRLAAHGDRPRKILFVGRVSREKNLETLVLAFRLLCRRRPDVSLVVVGDGPYRQEMEFALEGLPALFTGPLHGDSLAAAYASADCFAFPSETDTFGRVLLEAQASGLPVVAAAKGGPLDVVEHDHTGILLPRMSPEPLARAIEAVLDPARHDGFRAAARAHALRFTPARSFAQYWAVNELARARPATPAPTPHAHGPLPAQPVLPAV